MVSLAVKVLLITCALLLLTQRWWFPLGVTLVGLAALPARWQEASALSIISQQHDHFDLTFASYDLNQSIAGSQYTDVVPPILHHINLGPRPPRQEWMDARANCIEHHQGWEAFLWDNARANAFVAKEFPHLNDMWQNYRYPVQRVDALRYMVLQKYGGAVLDFDLVCKRSMGPLRRFEFVAPAAHPTGFSIGMMLAGSNNTFVRDLVDNLPKYNRAWFLLPYVTVMFSTGCHYASTIFTLHKHRESFRILSGTDDNRRMHMLNGDVDTPLFRHLGSSSWHSFDASLINWFGHSRKGPVVVLVGATSFIVGSLFAVRLACRYRKRFASMVYLVDREAVEETHLTFKQA